MPKTSWVWKDGELFPPEKSTFADWEWALRSGAGAFETMLVKDGKLPFAARHHFRLREATGLLGIKLPWPKPEDLSTMVKDAVEKSSAQGWVRFRLQVNAAKRIAQGRELEPALALIDLELHPEDPFEHPKPVVLGSLSTEVLGGRSELSMFKTTQRGVYQLGERFAEMKGWQDCLLWGPLGIAESTRSNLWWIKGEELFTPPISTGCVAGVMRHLLYQELMRLRQTPVESLCNLDTLANADCIFLTNAFRGLQPVSNDGPVKGNPGHARLHDLMLKMKNLRDQFLVT
jgi:branched-chain amino acid aminotransferase